MFLLNIYEYDIKCECFWVILFHKNCKFIIFITTCKWQLNRFGPAGF